MDSQESKVNHHYDDRTEGFYLKGWNPNHIHLGLFEPEECPLPGDIFLSESPVLNRAVERMVDVVVAPAQLAQHHRVVDAGCGVGGTAIRLAKRYGCQVTGVNLNRKQLGIAQEKTRAAGVEDLVDFQYADCSQHLPFADNSIDIVVNIESACHYRDRKGFLREVHRILRPGGKIVAQDWMVRDGLSVEQVDQFVRPLCQSWALADLECPATYQEKLREVGLEITEFQGFAGMEMGNLQIVENNYNNLTRLYFAGMQTPAFLTLMEAVGNLYAPWKKGYFEVQRYCAVRPLV